MRALALTLLLFTPLSAHALDTAPWDRVLVAHAYGGGMDYAGIQHDLASNRDMQTFLSSIGTMPESEGLASWIDAYNATVVGAVLDRYPNLHSVRDVPGFFDHVRHRIAGQDRTLDETETFIRAHFSDARVHAALNCGARSCPALASRAFTAANVNASLDARARALVRNDLHVRVRRDGKLELSSIFTWYQADFVRDAGSVLAWLRRYDDHGKLAHLAPNAPTVARDYDWRLNDFFAPGRVLPDNGTNGTIGLGNLGTIGHGTSSAPPPSTGQGGS